MEIEFLPLDRWIDYCVTKLLSFTTKTSTLGLDWTRGASTDLPIVRIRKQLQRKEMTFPD